MYKLQLVPNVSVGPFVFGMEQAEVHAMMKREFGSEQDPLVERRFPVYESEYYDNLNVRLEYKEGKLITVYFIDNIKERFIEIHFGGVKIWPRTKKKFASIFGRDIFEDDLGVLYHKEYSLIAGWDGQINKLIVGQEGYCAEMLESIQLFFAASSLSKGMSRSECRKLMERQPEISDDGRTDIYRHGFIEPDVISLAYDPDDLLLTVTQLLPDGQVVNLVG